MISLFLSFSNTLHASYISFTLLSVPVVFIISFLSSTHFSSQSNLSLLIPSGRIATLLKPNILEMATPPLQ